jgi:hypothetical protein
MVIPKRSRHLLPALLLSLLPLVTRAQTVHWKPATGTLTQGQETQIQLVYENCTPKNRHPGLPATPGLHIQPTSSISTAHTLVNGQHSSTRSHTYRIRPTSPPGTTVTIPAFTIETSNGPITTAAATYTITAPASGKTGGGSTADANGLPATASLAPPPTPPYAGQVFPLVYTLELNPEHDPRYAPPQWENPPLAHEGFPERPARHDTLRNGTPRIRLQYTTRAMAPQTGELALPPLTQELALATRRDSFFGFAQHNRYTLTTPSPPITTRPLPLPSPPGFNGAIGQFKLASRITPRQVAAGNPVTWTLELAGTGNWPALTTLPSRDIPGALQLAAHPPAQKTPVKDKIFDATLSEDLILLPTQPGRYTLGPVQLSIFNPETDSYETLTAPATTIEVIPGATPPPALPHTVGDAAAETPPAPPPPPPPGPIPHDPLSQAPPATPPHGNLPRFALLLVLPPLLFPCLAWLLHARHRARATHPNQARRQAHRQLTRLHRQLRHQQPEPPAPGQLCHWQRLTATLAGIPHAAPTSSHFSLHPHVVPLWRATEDALYDGKPLPADWLADATRAHRKTRCPRVPIAATFRRKNLFPFFLLFFAPAAIAEPHAGALAAYASADYAAAETHLRAHLQTVPTDWVAHHNLALALAQQDRWAESAAHALAAFVQHPSPATQRHLRLAQAKSALPAPAPLRHFLEDSPQGRLAILANPTQWQNYLCAATILLTLTLVALVHRAYNARLRKKLPPWVVAAVLLINLLNLALPLLALRVYGVLAHPRTAIVWQPSTLYSIPTEASARQQVTTLPAGTLVTLGKTYLGWRQVACPDAETGWLRPGHTLALWICAKQ